MLCECQVSASAQRAAALEVTRPSHPEDQVFGFALKQLFLAEVAADFSSQGHAAVAQTDLQETGKRSIPPCE